jgi:surface protein
MKKITKCHYKGLAFLIIVLSALGGSQFGFMNESYSDQADQFAYKKFTLPQSADPDAFISVWDTTIPGMSGSDEIKLPLLTSGTYNFFVDWGDNTNDTITSSAQTAVTHTYSVAGIYMVNITGTIVGWRFNNGGDYLKIIEIMQWGSLRVGNAGDYFSGCQNLVISANDSLDLTGMTTLYRAFRFCQDIGSNGNMNGWDTSQITNMSHMFEYAYAFNQDLTSWDVSNVEDMSFMFYHTWRFNQSIGNWDVSGVTNMAGLFYGAADFNQNINDWDVSNVIDMNQMFRDANWYNQPLNKWDVSNVIDMSMMFYSPNQFNQSLNAWDVSNVITMNNMFYDADSYNQPMDNWNVSSLIDMSSMFYAAPIFNQRIDMWDVSNAETMQFMFAYADGYDQPLNAWNISGVTDLSYMFYQADNFNQSLSNWDTSNVVTMAYMFHHDVSFNQPLNSWDVSKVASMDYMFARAYNFNQPLDNWNVSRVTRMFHMFEDATSFNQDISMWNVSAVTNFQGFLTSGMSRENYDNLWLGWSQLPTLQADVIFDGGLCQYTYISWDARQTIRISFGWTINDDPNSSPGNTTISTDAGNPDRDGSFTISWTETYVTTNYTLYTHTSPITDVNESLTVLLNESAELSYDVIDASHETHYYAILGRNPHKDILSDSFVVFVDRSPGVFTLSTDATLPDLDGIFSLTWTASELADNYTIYQHSSPITEINSSITKLVSETPNLSLDSLEYTDGVYFFTVVASNIFENRTSNCVNVTINIPMTLQIITPSISTSWEAESYVYINWSSTGSIFNVRIELYDGEAYVLEIIGITSNDGELYWKVPVVIGDSENYRIKISDATNASTYAYSNYFSIHSKTTGSPQSPSSNPAALILSIISLVISISGISYYVYTLLRKTHSQRSWEEKGEKQQKIRKSK